MSNERTGLFAEHFQAKRQQCDASDRVKGQPIDAEEDPFAEVMIEITEQTRDAVRRADLVVKESLRHISDVTYSELIQEDLETRLKLVAAELSTSTTLASGLSTVVEKAALKIQSDARGVGVMEGGGSDEDEELRDAKGDNILADLFGKSFKVTAWMGKKQPAANGAAALEAQRVAKRRLALLDTLAHYASAASIAAVVASQKRLDVAVCTEEIEAHRAAFLEPVGAWGVVNEADDKGKLAIKKVSPATFDSTTSGKVSGVLGIASKLKMASDMGNEVVGSALTSSTNHLASTMVSFLKKTRGDAGSSAPTPATTAATAESAPSARQRYVYSDVELAELEQQRQEILLEERNSKSTSAREIEQSIQEVSSLTSLMKEQVAMQDEQLQAIMGNTQASHDNISKASRQLDTPLQSFWNSTRMLIALMWISTLLLLTTHWIIR